MLNVTIGTNTSRKKVIVAPNMTLRAVLEQNNVNTNVGTVCINGEPQVAGNLDKTLEELNVTNNAFIISVAKADNAR